MIGPNVAGASWQRCCRSYQMVRGRGAAAAGQLRLLPLPLLRCVLPVPIPLPPPWGHGISLWASPWWASPPPPHPAPHIDRLLLETDAPYLTPRSITPAKARPSRNEPALLPAVLEAVAAARGQTPGHVAQVTTLNARRLFHLPAEQRMCLPACAPTL